MFTYIENTCCNMWAVHVSTIFSISCSDSLPGIWWIKFWVPFYNMLRISVTTVIILVLSFHIFVTLISRSLNLETFRNSSREIFLSAGTATSIMIYVFSSNFFIVMSGRFVSIFLSVLIVKSHRIVAFVHYITGCGKCKC